MGCRLWQLIVAGFSLFLALEAHSASLDQALEACTEHIVGGWPTGADGTALCRLGYATLHDDSRKIPRWSAYRLTTTKATACLDRTNDFRPDSNLPTTARAQLIDYEKSGYDRGHIVPAADMQWDRVAMSQSFLLSNMAPQLGSFNRGIWKQLETRVRIWARDRGEIIVIDGPYFEGSESTVGPDNVAVPAGFFKVVLDPKTDETQAFLLPHGRIPSADLPHYAVSIRAVEQHTGLDFMPQLSKAKQDELEAAVTPMWPADTRGWTRERRITCPADKD